MRMQNQTAILPSIADVHAIATLAADGTELAPSLVRAAAALTGGVCAHDDSDYDAPDCVQASLVLRKVEANCEQLCACLEESACVVCALRFADSAVEDGVWSTDDVVGAGAGVVCMLIVGYSVFDRIFLCQMPWGMRFGERGFLRLPFEYIDSTTVIEAFACELRDRCDTQQPLFV